MTKRGAERAPLPPYRRWAYPLAPLAALAYEGKGEPCVP